MDHVPAESSPPVVPAVIGTNTPSMTLEVEVVAYRARKSGVPFGLQRRSESEARICLSCAGRDTLIGKPIVGGQKSGRG